uniref:Uncharacterized protein n=1 Tax=Brassica campestris TaxID=3711 RepID=M4CLJ7_BRACM
MENERSTAPPCTIPERIFKAGKEPTRVRVTPYHKPFGIKQILNALEPEEIEKIRASPFGKFVELADKPSFSGRFGRYIISRQLKVSCYSIQLKYLKPHIINSLFFKVILSVYRILLVARDTDLPLAATLLKAYAKVEPLTIAELNYLLSLLHPRTLTSYVPGELLALTWTKGGVMLHAPNAVKLQHTVSAIAFVQCDNAHAVGTFRYRVETAIADGTAEGTFFRFDGVVTKLHSLRASEAGQMLIGSDDDGDDMPDGNPIPVKVETGGSSGEAAFNADTDPVGVRRRRRPTHLPRWLRRRVWLEID